MTVTINGTTGVAVPLGSVSAPGVSNTTSSTTGIYNPTSTTLGIATNGINAVYVDATQNVGIGTTSPGTYGGLVVNAASGVGSPLTLLTTDVGANTQVIFKGNKQYQIGTGNTSSGFANVLFFYDGTAAATRMLIDTSGNLQVGGTTVGNTAGYVNSRTNARAWCNFNGTLAGPITPRANYNISSITKNGTGDYTLNFTTALADANYAVTFGICAYAAASYTLCPLVSGSAASGPTTKTTSAVRVLCGGGSALYDNAEFNVMILGN